MKFKVGDWVMVVNADPKTYNITGNGSYGRINQSGADRVWVHFISKCGEPYPHDNEWLIEQKCLKLLTPFEKALFLPIDALASQGSQSPPPSTTSEIAEPQHRIVHY